MENGDILLPYSMAFVMRQLSHFDSINCTLEAKITFILRIKFSGCVKDVQKVINHVKNDLKCKINGGCGEPVEGL